MVGKLIQTSLMIRFVELKVAGFYPVLFHYLRGNIVCAYVGKYISICVGACIYIYIYIYTCV